MTSICSALGDTTTVELECLDLRGSGQTPSEAQDLSAHLSWFVPALSKQSLLSELSHLNQVIRVAAQCDLGHDITEPVGREAILLLQQDETSRSRVANMCWIESNGLSF